MNMQLLLGELLLDEHLLIMNGFDTFGKILDKLHSPKKFIHNFSERLNECKSKLNSILCEVSDENPMQQKTRSPNFLIALFVAAVMIVIAVPAMGGYHGRSSINVWRGPSKGKGHKKHASFGYHFKHPAPQGGKHHYG
ncbi:unnamed protein product [Medioppia subpectinata]|uniref:Uncharacterized protein n=1 Tax=Medioppia subpectinata TaxID=1979941 RepID=A0A7R9KX45_9ACAR|nr:unnamed protein product [Medioppia subpectinata]CAG2111343.1 unnamed protein product [Medioppia subpectinata]